MSEIPAVAFRFDEEQNIYIIFKFDIVIQTNNTSLHNEFIMQRLGMVPYT